VGWAFLKTWFFLKTQWVGLFWVGLFLYKKPGFLNPAYEQWRVDGGSPPPPLASDFFSVSRILLFSRIKVIMLCALAINNDGLVHCLSLSFQNFWIRHCHTKGVISLCRKLYFIIKCTLNLNGTSHHMICHNLVHSEVRYCGPLSVSTV